MVTVERTHIEVRCGRWNGQGVSTVATPGSGVRKKKANGWGESAAMRFKDYDICLYIYTIYIFIYYIYILYIHYIYILYIYYIYIHYIYILYIYTHYIYIYMYRII